MREREKCGAFRSLEDFFERTPAGLEECRILIKAGAMDSFEATNQTNKRRSKAEEAYPEILQLRRRLMLQAECLYRMREVDANSFMKLRPPMARPTLLPSAHAAQELAALEQEALGYSVSLHPLDLVKIPPDTVAARDIRQYRGKRITMIGWVISVKLMADHEDDNLGRP